MIPPRLPAALALALAALLAGCSAPLPPTGAAAARSRGAGEPDGTGDAPAVASPAGGEAAARPTDPWMDDLTVLARVNGEVVHLRRIRHSMGPAYEQFLTRKDELAVLVQARLREIVLRELVVAESRRLGLDATDEAMEEAEKRQRDRAARDGSTLEQLWRDLGITRREWTEDLREHLIEENAEFFLTGQYPPQAYREEGFRPSVDFFVTPEEIRAWGDRHPAEISKPASATLRILDLRVDSFRKEGADGEEAWRLCEAAAGAARERFAAGEAFADLARALSEGPEAGEGGLLGPVLPDGPQRREVREWAFAPGRAAGDCSGPIRTPAGFVLLFVESRDEPRTLPIEEWGPRARAEVEYLKKLRAWHEVRMRLVEEASIEPEAVRRSIHENLAGLVRAIRAELPRPRDPRTSSAAER